MTYDLCHGGHMVAEYPLLHDPGCRCVASCVISQSCVTYPAPLLLFPATHVELQVSLAAHLRLAGEARAAPTELVSSSGDGCVGYWEPLIPVHGPPVGFVHLLLSNFNDSFAPSARCVACRCSKST
jgi:hypothetical protein